MDGTPPTDLPADPVEGQPSRLAWRPAEVAAMLGVTPRTITAWCDAGLLPCVRVGRTRLIPAAAIEDLLAASDPDQSR